jgi:hypothetical protein
MVRNDPAYYRANKTHQRNLNLKSKFGMTRAEYERLREQQDNRCAICKVDKPGGRGDWHVDHNHETGVSRGLLCLGCNIGLGCFKDDPAFLEAAALYLRRFVK